jgi:hypothetical protein
MPDQPKSPRVNPTRGAPNYAESSHLILSVILRVYSHHDSVGENPIRTWATCLWTTKGSKRGTHMSGRAEMLRQFILEAMANDYESFECIEEQVKKWMKNEQTGVTKQELALTLETLITEGYARAYILSPVPPHSKFEKFSLERLDELWYHLTTRGKQLVKAL